MQCPKKRIDQLLAEACDLSLQWIEYEARRILKEHPNLEEFVMGMGSAFFTAVGNVRDYIDTDERTYMKKLDDFLNEFTPDLKLTGVPMRFTAHGPKITSWGAMPEKSEVATDADS